MEKLLGSQSVIVTLDVDAFLMEKLQQIVAGGFTVVEVNSVDPVLIQKIVTAFPSLKIGAGNIIDPHQLEVCYQAGAHFITSPGLLSSISQTANVYGITYLPGVATLSEAMQAMTLGCFNVRPYPANLTFCTLVNKALPLLRLFPAEVEWEEAEHFLNLPSVAAVSILNPETKQLRTLSSGILV
ncbi:keto-hydroxyglutarate aldolase [Legionella adelaidensis]|uniref:Keto-hydroxyglutarate aldolase n=1 Tax=Legionella adelaidensis TaxID=45056 RepID=A0A0W0R400_9GAMM|nr:bifunctional 4-hydroxy-2-oxoglutarate aldolase/2-dehydro-3-deoxy-phosphogluconate aldolase [Legionella adelaidensis]KTC65769.1 keto-hydroxyglutarate aldolase [Legionella adelaidensis]